MFFINDPGPWNFYVNRQDNKGLPLMEIRDKYLREQLIFEQQINFIIQQQRILAQTSNGGPRNLIDNLSSNQYVVDDYIDNYFE